MPCVEEFEKQIASVDKISDDEKSLIMPFRALDGLGDNVADAIVKAREGGPFISMEDLRNRGKVNNSALEKLKELKIMDDDFARIVFKDEVKQVRW